MTTLRVGVPNVIWLEDKESDTSSERNAAMLAGCVVHMRGNPREVMVLLREGLGEPPEPKLVEEYKIVFIVDVMIEGLLDLSGLGIPRSDTHGGLNGGYVFVDRVIRRPMSPYRLRPVCFLSERQLTSDMRGDLDYLRQRRDPDDVIHGAVEYVRKQSAAELQRFKSFVASL